MTTPDTDVRPPLSEVEQIAQLKRDLDDLRSTMMARISRQPTGDIEPTIRTTPKPDTLLLQGQTVGRAAYPVLWQWVTEQGLVAAGLFTSGDGLTTFGLPDLRGRTVVGADAGRAVGTLFGAQTRAITTGNLPAHRHTGGTGADSPGHEHGGSTGVDGPGHEHPVFGNHAGHVGRTVTGGGGTGFAWWDTLDMRFSGDLGNTGGANRAHTHGFGTGGANRAHFHGFTTDFTGNGDPLNIESPAISVNWLIWT